MSKQPIREGLVTYLMRDMPDRPNILEHDPYQWAYPVADRILVIMAPELRDAFCNGAAYGWLHGYRLDETCEDAAKQALRRWPDKE